MTRASTLLFTLCALALAGMAATRLSFNVDLLDLLPEDLREVQGLREFTERFAGDGELIIALDQPGADPEVMSAHAGALANRLRDLGGLVSRVEWRPIWEENPAAAAELPAYLWLNGDTERMRMLSDRLQPGNSEAALADAIEELSFGFDGEALAFTAYDPYGLLRPPGTEAGMGGGGDGKFASADGDYRALYVSSPESLEPGYKAAAAWLAKIQGEVERWAPPTDGPNISYTGEPAYEAEIGGGMERDMTGSVIGAMVLIHLLFWLMHRQMLPLVAMFLTLSMVLSVTVLIGSMWFGKLSVMSVGFAAILVGLAVDYGVVLYQESRSGDGSSKSLVAKVAPSILWAAITTAAVFASLGLSSLPGIRELGLLVGVGIVVGAGLMLKVFAPKAAVLGALKPLAPPVAESPQGGVAGDRRALMATGVLILAVGGVLLTRGLPGLYTSFDALRPTNSSADAAYQKLSERLIDDGGDTLPLVVVAENHEQLGERAYAANALIETLRESGALRSSAFLPDLIPSGERQGKNALLALELLKQEGRLSEELAVDFEIEAQGVLGSVFGAWRSMLEGNLLPTKPRSAAAQRTLNDAIDESGSDVATVGLLRLEEGKWQEVRDAFASEEGVYLTGWPTLGPAVRPLILHDVRAVFVPMGIVLVVMLIVVFRRPGDIALAMGVPGFVGHRFVRSDAGDGLAMGFPQRVCLPLAAGDGDRLHGPHDRRAAPARRRPGGRAAWDRPGVALLRRVHGDRLRLSRDGGKRWLASLGRVCASGILITMVVAVFLLPAWRRRLTP